MKSSLNDLQPFQLITNPKNNNIMRDYDKMKQEGWINQHVIEQELAQERRAAKRAFQLKKAQIMANAEEICKQAMQEYLQQLKRINENRDEAIRQEEAIMEAKFMEVAREEDVLRRNLHEMGILNNHKDNNSDGQ